MSKPTAAARVIARLVQVSVIDVRPDLSSIVWGRNDMPLHILVVEDDVVNRRYLAELLGAQGHQCRLTGALGEAQLALSEHSFDLCLVDQRLPDGLGASLRASAAPTRVVMMSGDPAPDGQDWLLKPIAAEALAQLVDGHVANDAKPDAYESGSTADLDDELARRSLGAGIQAVAGLRRLLRAELRRELPELQGELQAGQRAAVLARLHRWKASGALCGAARLTQACRALENDLRLVIDTDASQHQLEQAVARLLALP
jgi:two-component system, NarL family, capsular synthesis sensor histidine kinase RcsC